MLDSGSATTSTIFYTWSSPEILYIQQNKCVSSKALYKLLDLLKICIKFQIPKKQWISNKNSPRNADLPEVTKKIRKSPQESTLFFCPPWGLRTGCALMAERLWCHVVVGWGGESRGGFALTHTIHGTNGIYTYIHVHTFTIKKTTKYIGKYTIPYMDPMGSLRYLEMYDLIWFEILIPRSVYPIPYKVMTFFGKSPNLALTPPKKNSSSWESRKTTPHLRTIPRFVHVFFSYHLPNLIWRIYPPWNSHFCSWQ